MNILTNVLWCFDATDYPTSDAFDQAVAQYQYDIRQERADWHPGEVVIENPEVDIIYECWPGKSEPLSANETLVAAYDGGDYEEREVLVRLVADNKRAFTTLNLLYQLHQHLRTKALGDHYFFEGLTPADDADLKQPPLFHLKCGS